jgi:hypothetical protein
MTTLVLDEKSEQTPIGDVLRNASGDLLEIRDVNGDLMATVVISTVKAGFDYSPYLDEAQRIIDEHRRKPFDRQRCLTTAELMEKLHNLEAAE